MLCHNLWYAVDALLSMQVHILEDPSEEELGWKLEKLHPDFLVLHGDCPPGKDDVGSLVLRDGKLVTSEILTSFFGSKFPDLVCPCNYLNYTKFISCDANYLL